jgi:hypothetical protein
MSRWNLLEDPEENICMSSIETIVTLKSLERVTKAVRNIIDKILAEERITPEEGIIYIMMQSSECSVRLQTISGKESMAIKRISTVTSI